jgi:hypothetical protein
MPVVEAVTESDNEIFNFVSSVFFLAATPFNYKKTILMRCSLLILFFRHLIRLPLADIFSSRRR